MKPPRLIAVALMAFLAVSQALAQPDISQRTRLPHALTADDAALAPAELRQAIIGERFAYRGQFREGGAATAFAEGYIFALAEHSARQGAWCGFKKILPHELIGQVFESLPTPEHASVNDATAAEHVVDFLHDRFPCNMEPQRPLGTD